MTSATIAKPRANCHRVVELSAENFSSISDLLRKLILADPQLNAMHTGGLKQFEYVKCKATKDRLIRDDDSLETTVRLYPSEVQMQSLEVPALLASELTVRGIIWKYFKDRIAKSKLKPEQKCKRIERCRRAILALKGDLDPPSVNTGKPRLSSAANGKSFADAFKNAVKKAISKSRNDRFVTSALKRHAFKILPEVLTQEQKQILFESCEKIRQVRESRLRSRSSSSPGFNSRFRVEVLKILESQSARTQSVREIPKPQKEDISLNTSFFNQSSRFKPIDAQYLCKIDLDSAPELKPHPEMQCIEFNGELPTHLVPSGSIRARNQAAMTETVKDKPVGQGINLENVFPNAAKTTRQELKQDGPVQIRQITPDVIRPGIALCRGLNGLLCVRLSRGVVDNIDIESMRVLTTGALPAIEFEIPESIGAGRKLEELKQLLEREYDQYGCLLEDPILDPLSQILIKQGCGIQGLQNWVLSGRCFHLPLASSASLEKITIKHPAILRLYGERVKCSQVVSDGGILDLQVQQSLWSDCSIFANSLIRGSFGEGSFNAGCRLHAYAAEADFSKCDFQGADLDNRLRGLIAIPRLLPAGLRGRIKANRLSLDQYEARRSKMDEEFGAENCAKLLAAVPFKLGTRGPRNNCSNDDQTGPFYRIHITDPMVQQENLYITPPNLSKLCPCFLLRGESELPWPAYRVSRSLEAIHIHDAILMVMDKHFGKHDQREWWQRKRYYFNHAHISSDIPLEIGARNEQ